MGDIWLVRHGETAWSRSGKHTGLTDIPLTADGERQVTELHGRLDRPWAAVFSSPLQRALRTAELAGHDPIPDEDLREWDYGPAEGLTTAELSVDGPWSVWEDPPLGETLLRVAERAQAVLQRLPVDRGDVLLFSHGHLLRILTAVYLGLDPRAAKHLVLLPASVGVLGTEHDYPALLRWGL